MGYDFLIIASWKEQGRKMHRVLLIEDSAECQLVVRRALANPEIQLVLATTIEEAKKIVNNIPTNPLDLIILDVGLPDGDGLSFLDYFGACEFFQDIPVFLLTASKDLFNKVTAFGLGAEDYLVKPVSPIELKARVEMRLRKLATKRKSTSVIKKGDLILETALMRASLSKNGRETVLDLTSKEFKILTFLAQNENEVYSREQIVKAVWGSSVHVLDRTVDSHICSLRKKLGEFAGYIESIPSAGYRFCFRNTVGNDLHNNPGVPLN